MPSVFVSYSQKDEEALDELLTLLAPLKSQNLLDVWVDRDIPPGANWEQEIDAALTRANVAVLMISPAFLASEFIRTNELPRIFARHARGELHVLPVFLKHALAEVPLSLQGVPQPVKLSSIQGCAKPDKPLSDYAPSEHGRELVKLARQITSLAAARVTLSSGTAATPGEVARREFELRVRLSHEGDRIHVQYERPGLGLLDAGEQSSPDTRALEIARVLDEARHGRLTERVGAAVTDWGPALFQILFPAWKPVLRQVYECQGDVPQPTPTYGAVRVWVDSDDALLRGLPWRLTAWQGQLLGDCNWTFAVTHDRAPLARHVRTHARAPILVVTDQAAADDVKEAVTQVWGPHSAPAVANTRQDVEAALRGTLHLHIVYVHGHLANVTGRPSLVLHGAATPDSVPLVELGRWLREATPAPAVIYLNVTRDEGVAAEALEPLIEAAPLVLWRRLPERAPDSTTRALMWLRHWLREALRPRGRVAPCPLGGDAVESGSRQRRHPCRLPPVGNGPASRRQPPRGAPGPRPPHPESPTGGRRARAGGQREAPGAGGGGLRRPGPLGGPLLDAGRASPSG